MIRPATTADLPALRAVQQTSLDEPWQDLLETAVEGPLVALVVTPEQSAVTTAEGSAPAAQHGDDDPIGYAIAIPEGDTAYLVEFAVAPEYRGKSHGTRLMSELLDRLADGGIEEVRLTVRVSDRRARSFYDARGFHARSLLPNQYADDDALLLVQSLPAGGTDR